MTHDPLCCQAEGKFDGYCQCQLIARVREDERDCDNHGDTIRYRCQHYQQGRKDGYDAALREAVEAVIQLCGHTKYEGCTPCPHDEAVAAIDALLEEKE